MQNLSRRRFLTRTVTGLSAAAVATAGNSSARAADKRPNILVVFTDDQRYDTLSCHGHPHLTLTKIDSEFSAKPSCRLSKVLYTNGDVFLPSYPPCFPRHGGFFDAHTPSS